MRLRAMTLALVWGVALIVGCSSSPPGDGASDLEQIEAGWEATRLLLDPSETEVVEDGIGICATADASSKSGAEFLAFIDTDSLLEEADVTRFAADWERELEQTLNREVAVEVESLESGSQLAADAGHLYFLLSPTGDGPSSLKFAANGPCR